MKTVRVLAAALMASAAFVVTAPAASAADQCKSACNERYSTCQRGRNTAPCMQRWGQCKAACRTGGAVAAHSPGTGPAVPATPVVRTQTTAPAN